MTRRRDREKPSTKVAIDDERLVKIYRAIDFVRAILFFGRMHVHMALIRIESTQQYGEFPLEILSSFS